MFFVNLGMKKKNGNKNEDKKYTHNSLERLKIIKSQRKREQGREKQWKKGKERR